jgi:N-acetylated-alpha-linked acidic dipeptidase
MRFLLAGLVKKSSFLKKRTKKLLLLSGGAGGSGLGRGLGEWGKSFLVLFFKKEHFFLFLATLSPAAAAPAPPDQASIEHQFDAAIHPDDLRGWLKTMAAEPNQVGAPHDRANAEFELKLFRAWGWDAHIESFEVLYPTPISESLALTTPVPFTATLQEPPIPGDESTAHLGGALPAYVAYQGDGDVTAPVVYVNYGMPDDYKELYRLGVDVRGKIVIARYGGGWRGLKPKLAQEHGAVGCIIYSDPADDGYGVEKTYPNGPARPPHGIQRGSVADMPIYPGDPLTPGIGATKDAKRLPRAEAKTILKIPVLPISYADAQHFLAPLEGPVAPESWRGALPITYHIGPGPATAHLAVTSDWGTKTIYDVIATLRGADYPDQWVIRGNHHDGWVFGASDPLSGQIALLAEAQAIGELAKQGMRPKRTLVYASWDAEEPGLIGSTEWVETHAAELKQHALLYINTDTNERGILGAGGSPDFQHLVNQVAADVTDPETHVSVAARWRAALRVAAVAPGASPRAVAAGAIAANGGHDLPLAPLGSGSDFSSFLQHVGVPALDLEYGGEGDAGGVYHSAYDTFAHHSRFVDPGFVYDALLARTVGRLVLRAANQTLPVQRAGDFAEAVGTYLAEVKKLADAERQEAEVQASLLHDHAFQLADDPTKGGNPPKSLSPVPYFEFAPLDNAVARLRQSAHAYDSALSHHAAELNAAQVSRVQTLMLSIDQTLAPDVGLPGRPWYRNLIFAPGRLTGYGAKTLPGVREAIEDRRWSDADHYARLTADALNAYSDRLDEARKVLEAY